MTTLAVIIPTRDRLPLLKEAIASVTAQTHRGWEIVVVDDSSKDGTGRWLAELEDDRIRVVQLPGHSERSRARNAGLAATDRDFVLFLDDDDRLHPDAIDYLLRAFDAPRVVAAVGGETTFDDRGHRKRYPHPRRGSTKDVRFDILAGWSATPGRWLLRTQVVRDAGGWDESLTFAEDADLWLRVANRGLVAVLPRPVLEKRVHPGQSSPEEAERISEDFRLRFAESLSGEERSRGVAAVGLRRERRAAEIAVSRGEFRTGLRHVATAVKASPKIASSSLVRPALSRSLRRGIVGLLFGQRFFGLIRNVRAKVRRVSNRMPGEE